jgi:hypothetical protein
MQVQGSPNPEIVSEIYRTLVLLGADHQLLGTVGSWGDSLPDEDVIANLRAWNQATFSETTARIEHYELSCSRPACSPVEARKTAHQGR